jgi:glycosyltransferase involved in cell wall biosynthesis
VLVYGGGSRYVPTWFEGLDAAPAGAHFATRRLSGPRDALSAAGSYDAVIAPVGGGAILPAAYAGARRAHKPFILWASLWARSQSLTHALAAPLTRRIYRRADAVIAYGEHVRRFVADIRGRDSDIYIAPQAVESELFANPVSPKQIDEFRRRHDLPPGPLVTYVGRLVSAKGIEVLLRAWESSAQTGATLALIGDGELAPSVRNQPRARLLGVLSRAELPIAYAASELVILPSIPTRRFTEPWGLVCNEAMHQGVPVIASDAVGAVAGGLVRDGQSGLVVPAGDAPALQAAIDRLLADESLRTELGATGKQAVSKYTYEAMLSAFDAALETAIGARPRRRSTT